MASLRASSSARMVEALLESISDDPVRKSTGVQRRLVFVVAPASVVVVALTSLAAVLGRAMFVYARVKVLFFTKCLTEEPQRKTFSQRRVVRRKPLHPKPKPTDP